MRYYRYDVVSYDIDAQENQSETGIIAAENYAKAAADLVEYFGEDELEKFTLSILADAPLIVNDEAIKEIEKKVIW